MKTPLLAAFAFASLLSAAVGSAAEPRPNILFVITDDQSWRDTGIAGSRIVHTPAFDRVAREGAHFTHSFCASPSCTPSRRTSA
jgi:N-sulfoglucosamine sulfohydrolase